MPKRPGRKSAAQTPAPKSERIKGSSTNPKGSASSEKSAKSIELSSEIINALSDKAKKFNEDHPTKKVSVNTLKAVFRRGAGAYSSTHRPTITGGKPNSRTAWAYARVNTFLDKKAGKPTKAAYVQDDDLLEQGGTIDRESYAKGGMPKVRSSEANDIKDYILKQHAKGESASWSNNNFQYVARLDGTLLSYDLNTSKYKFYNDLDSFIRALYRFQNRGYAKGGLIAPNGKPSNLTPKQYKLVRTKEFKAWFGDWENDPENASKVVDENGEPLVVYHGTRSKKDFYIFKHNKVETIDKGFHGVGFYFTPDKEISERYRLARNSKIIGKLYSCFLNIRKPYKTNKNFSTKPKRNDGTMGYAPEYLYNPVYGHLYEIMVTNSEQIKLADGSNTTFDGTNPDIRYADGGLTAVRLYDTIDTAKDIDDIVRIAKEKNIDAKELSYDEFAQKVREELPNDLDFVELRLAYNELKKYAHGGETKKIIQMKAKGNCYEAAGDIVISHLSPFSALRFSMGHEFNFIGEPYLVHAEVAGQGALEGIRYGHAWVEDDIMVYDYSNGRQITLPKEFYYKIGDVDTSNPKKYQRYTFQEAKRKFLDTGTYGCWDIETEYRDGGKVYNDEELLEKWKAGEKIGFSATAHLKSKGLIPRSDGSKRESMEQGGEPVAQDRAKITCSNCGWSWSVQDSDPFDMYVCHQCGTDNTPKLLETGEVARMNGYVLLRFLEFAKEDAKTDMELHKLVENIMALSATKTLTMDDYDKAMEGIAPAEMAEGGQVFDADYYGVRKTMLNNMYKQYLAFTDNMSPSQLEGLSKEEWAKKSTLDWASKMGKRVKNEQEEVLVDVRTGQVVGKRKDFMIRPQFKNGGVVQVQDLNDYNQDIVRYGGYEIGSTAYLAKKDSQGKWISAGKIVGYKEKGRFNDLYVVTEKGNEIHNTQLLELAELSKYGFKMAEGGETTSVISIDLDKLDPLERLMYEDMSTRMTKEQALRAIANTFEADGQLSEELEKYAAKIKLEEQYASQLQSELDTLAHYYDKPFTLWVSNNEASGGWEFFDVEQAVEAANNFGILENNNDYQIRDTASGRLVLNKSQILDVISGKAQAQEFFAFGGDVAEDVMDEIDSEVYIQGEKEEARAILYSRKMSKLQKILFISDRIDYARDQMKRAEDGLAENVWEEVFDIWKDAFARVENNYCERTKDEYKQGGVTSDCGCGKYYAKGGLAYGNSHAKGGMPMTVKSTGQNIEIEGGEGVVNKKSMQMTKKVTLNGEDMTPCEAVSELNQMGGGVKFKCSDVKEVIDQDGNF